ncbi:MAG: SMI1/KNR4 family protein [Pseudomonadota bacterium]
MQSDLTAHATLIKWWSSGEDLPAKADIDESFIQGLENRMSISLPKDFRDYLLHAAPKEDHWDEAQVTWWSPSRLNRLAEEYEHPISDAKVYKASNHYLVFADYSIWCWAWAICCDNSGNRGQVVVIAGGQADKIVADSFTQFVALFASNPDFAVECLGE